jgi:hypothetical protein
LSHVIARPYSRTRFASVAFAPPWAAHVVARAARAAEFSTRVPTQSANLTTMDDDET